MTFFRYWNNFIDPYLLHWNTHETRTQLRGYINGNHPLSCSLNGRKIYVNRINFRRLDLEHDDRQPQVQNREIGRSFTWQNTEEKKTWLFFALTFYLLIVILYKNIITSHNYNKNQIQLKLPWFARFWI